MKQFFLISKLVLTCLIIVGAHGIAYAQKLPVIDGREAVAVVNDEPITLDELNQAIADSHNKRFGEQKAGSIDFSGIMKRLINIRLLLLEARNMGLDELPELQRTVESYAQKTMIELLFEQHVKDVTADEDEIEKLYKEEIKEWKVKEITFKKEADAKKIEAQIKAGRNFDAAGKKAVAEGIAEFIEEEYLKNKDLKPRVTQLISAMKINAVSPVVFAGKNAFTIFKIEGIRYSEKEDPEARKKAMQHALNRNRVRAANSYTKNLVKKYVIIDEKLLDALDYESKTPGFENLLKDKRLVAEIAGEDPITVGKLSEALKKKFFHGIERAIERHKINRRKRSVLESMIEKRVLLKEAQTQGIDRTQTYETKIKEYKNALVFGAFIQKVVAPEIKLNEKELKAYYEKNRQKYTSPEMMKIKNLVFANKKDADETLDKLTKGTDFAWLNAHAGGQIDNTAKGLLRFEGRMIILNTMPEDVQKALSNAKPGDFRLYESPEGQFYILYVYHVVPPRPQPFESVNKDIAKQVYNDKVYKAVDAWAEKLKEYYPVKIFRKDLMK